MSEHQQTLHQLTVAGGQSVPQALASMLNGATGDGRCVSNRWYELNVELDSNGARWVLLQLKEEGTR